MLYVSATIGQDQTISQSCMAQLPRRQASTMPTTTSSLRRSSPFGYATLWQRLLAPGHVHFLFGMAPPSSVILPPMVCCFLALSVFASPIHAESKERREQRESRERAKSWPAQINDRPLTFNARTMCRWRMELGVLCTEHDALCAGFQWAMRRMGPNGADRHKSDQCGWLLASDCWRGYELSLLSFCK